MDRFLIAPLMVVAGLIVAGGEVLAQSAFPAPLPGQTGQVGTPPVNGGSPSATVAPPMSAFPSDGAPPIGGFGATPPPFQLGNGGCGDGFTPLREDAKRKRKSIEAARERRALPEEACKLIGSYRAAEVKMIEYVEKNTARCAILAQIADQLKADHKNTEALHMKVCALAQPMRKPAPAGPKGDFWPPSTSAPM